MPLGGRDWDRPGVALSLKLCEQFGERSSQAKGASGAKVQGRLAPGWRDRGSSWMGPRERGRRGLWEQRGEAPAAAKQGAGPQFLNESRSSVISVTEFCWGARFLSATGVCV